MDGASQDWLHKSDPSRVNAQAGPSSQPVLNPTFPDIFLPPPAPPKRKPLFDSTQDLITRFQLLSAYDKYVRPYVHPAGAPEQANQPPSATAPSQSPTSATFDKGKGREVPLPVPGTPNIPQTPAGIDGGDGDDNDEEGDRGDKKLKNSYRHLVKGIPGKHSIKKDDYLQTMMLVPPKQKIPITRFDSRTLRESFSVSLEGLKGWNIRALVAESAQAREDRKRSKELKKLAKAQAAQAGVPLPGQASGAPTNLHPQTPASAGIGTPRPQGNTGPPSAISTDVQAANGPRSATPIPRPGSRARKRELDEDNPGKWAPPGSGGVKTSVTRPIKRPRTDGPGLPTIPQQQPTPQGV